MKQILALLLTFVYCYSEAQLINRDSIVNYSYKIQGADIKTGKLINNGTGFIISYKDKDFLVTNYHVITGKDAITGKKIEELKDTCSLTLVFFRSLTDTPFHTLVMPLYGIDGSKNFSIYHVDKKRLFDLVVIFLPPMAYPPGIKQYVINWQQIDTSYNCEADKKCFVVGFPNGKMEKLWRPITLKNELICKKQIDDTIDPSVFFKKGSIGGMSGSPVYIEKNKLMYLIGINVLNTYVTKASPKEEGVAFKIKYVVQLMDEMIKQNKTHVDLKY